MSPEKLLSIKILESFGMMDGSEPDQKVIQAVDASSPQTLTEDKEEEKYPSVQVEDFQRFPRPLKRTKSDANEIAVNEIAVNELEHRWQRFKEELMDQ